ncbi:hypothetical protein HanRHA438_Chr13g0605261 [Helianthus annuus]|nr:hypothetical protein HanRHA438_Chr13g0605261 [Helianthus annuus]
MIIFRFYVSQISHHHPLKSPNNNKRIMISLSTSQTHKHTRFTFSKVKFNNFKCSFKDPTCFKVFQVSGSSGLQASFII